jgi:PAS domain S-box-containing protein
VIEDTKRMFPKSSIKRLRFAFAAMAGLTLLALVVGCATFAFSHAAHKQFADETTPLLIDIEQLSKVAIGFASASRQLETVSTQRHLLRALAHYRLQSDRLQTALLDISKHDLQAQMVGDLNDVVRELEAYEETYTSVLSSKIETASGLSALRREISDEGRTMQDQLNPLTLDLSLRLIDLVQGVGGNGVSEQLALPETLNQVQLLTGINFAVKRFLHATDGSDTAISASPDKTLRETIAPEFRRLAQLVLRLGDQDKRGIIAGSLQILNEKALGSGGVADRSQQLSDTARRLESLNHQRIVLLTRMTDLVDRIVKEARAHFFDGAESAQRKGLLAVSTLILFSTIAFAAVIWIGWRLINRDIAERLDRLTASTIALAGGDLDVTIDQTGSDELAGMARAAEVFRRNARELRRAETELADRLLEVEGTNEKLIQANGALDRANANLAESELRYELAVKGSAAGIWDWDAETDTLFWSDRLKHIVGLTDQALKLELSSFIDRVHPDDRALVIERRQQHLENGQDYDVECRLRHEDGSYVWIQNRGQAVWSDEGKPKRMVGSANDITDRKLAEIRLAQYAKELERSNQELDDFAHIAAHDLKEPLRAVYNHANFLLEDYQGKLDEEGEKRLHRMIKLNKRMEQLIADLLYFSRLGRGDQAMETLDLNEIIADIEASLVEFLQSRNAQIEVSGALPSVSGCHAHITALFRNLINNGVKYNDKEEKVLQIGLERSRQNGEAESYCTLFVRDNGIGIDEHFQADIFRIFKRLNSEKAYGEGTGAGLTFVKKIVENHGGSIWLESALGKGTTFFFTLKSA